MLFKCMLFSWLFLQESCLNLAIVYSVSLLLQVELLLKHQVDSLFAHSKLSIDNIFFPKMQWTKPSSFEHADRGNFHIHSLVCMEFSILVIVWEYEVFQTVQSALSFTTFICVLLSLYLFLSIGFFATRFALHVTTAAFSICNSIFHPLRI